MRSTLTRGAATAVLPTLGLLIVAGCGGKAGDTSTTPSPTAPTSASPTATSPSNTALPAADTKIGVTIANGKVDPSGVTINVRAGDTVQISVTSDANDEVHVHGYDKELPVSPGKPASVTFTANMKGTFEIETHESGKLIAKLVVS